MFRIFAAIIALVGAVGSVTYVKTSTPAGAQISHMDRAHAGKREPAAAPVAAPALRAERPKAKRKAKAKPKVKRERRTESPRPEQPRTASAWDSPFCRNARAQAESLPQAVRDRLTANASASQKRRYAPCFA